MWHGLPAGDDTGFKPVPRRKAARGIDTRRALAYRSTLAGVCACGVLLVGALIGGCVTGRPSPITPGMAKIYIKPGETRQATVIEVFGPPNIVTRSDGGEMWVYDKVSSHQTDAAFGIGGGGGGFGSAGAGGGLLGGGLSSKTRSETTVMLIVYYDERDIVEDYKITQTKF